jgi:hypothetical protein
MRNSPEISLALKRVESGIHLRDIPMVEAKHCRDDAVRAGQSDECATCFLPVGMRRPSLVRFFIPMAVRSSTADEVATCDLTRNAAVSVCYQRESFAWSFSASVSFREIPKARWTAGVAAPSVWVSPTISHG